MFAAAEKKATEAKERDSHGRIKRYTRHESIVSYKCLRPLPKEPKLYPIQEMPAVLLRDQLFRQPALQQDAVLEGAREQATEDNRIVT